jgi:hypothetical protein
MTAPERKTKDVMLTIPIERGHDPLTKVAARRSGHTVSGWVRFLILRELQTEGLVDEDFNAIPQEQEAIK